MIERLHRDGWLVRLIYLALPNAKMSKGHQPADHGLHMKPLLRMAVRRERAWFTTQTSGMPSFRECLHSLWLACLHAIFSISKIFSFFELFFMHKRNIYLERIRPFLGKPVVKVITGMRRVGKSYLLRQIIDLLRKDGVAEGNIHYVNMESLDFEHIRTYRDLHEEAGRNLLGKEGLKYLLVDEVQEISGWERAVASLSGRSDVDVLLTGSNAHLFSSELATLLSGRYVEFPVYSLGFREYLQFRGDRRTDIQSELLNYLRYGGLPAIHHFQFMCQYVCVSMLPDQV